MRNKIMMVIVFFMSMALYGEMEEYGEITSFIRDNLTMTLENGMKIIFSESYEDFMKKGFNILEEKKYYKSGGGKKFLRRRQFILGPSSVYFDFLQNMDGGFISGPGPSLMSGALKVGTPVGPLLKRLKADPRYIIVTSEIDLSLNKDKPTISISFRDERIEGNDAGYFIFVEHDKGKVTYISYGFI